MTDLQRFTAVNEYHRAITGNSVYGRILENFLFNHIKPYPLMCLVFEMYGYDI